MYVQINNKLDVLLCVCARTVDIIDTRSENISLMQAHSGPLVGTHIFQVIYIVTTTNKMIEKTE